MPMLRAVRMLQSVEANLTSGSQFETMLGDAGRVSDFSVLLGMREQVRRMANSDVTMTAIIASDIALNTTFALANPDNKVAVEYMALSPTAMSKLGDSLSSLDVIVENDTSWDTFTASTYYETHVLNIMHLFAGVATGTHATMSNFLSNGQATSAMVANPNTMKAALKSEPTITLISTNVDALNDIMASSVMLGLIVNSDSAMYIFVRSATALGELTDTGKDLIADTPSAIKISLASPLWPSIISGSTTLENNMRDVLVNGHDLDVNLLTAEAVLDDPASAVILAGSKPAMQAIDEVASATASLVASPVLTTFLANQVAIDVLSTNVSTMTSIIAVPAAIPIVLANPVSMAVIAANTGMVTTLVGDADSIPLLLANTDAVNIIAASSSLMTTLATNPDYLPSIIANPTTRTALAGNNALLTTLIGVSTALPQLLANSELIVAISLDVAANGMMDTLIKDADSFPLLLANDTTKLAIFNSGDLVTTMAGDAAAFAVLEAGAVELVGPTPNASIGTFQDTGPTGNIILLTTVMGSIVATTIGVNFRGKDGAQPASATFNVPGNSASTGPIPTVGAFTNMQHDANSTAATAAARVTITYYQF